MKFVLSATAIACFAFAHAAPASAQDSFFDHVPIGGALAAKVIGEICPNALTANETAEIKRYVDRVVAIEKAKSDESKALMEQLIPELDADYRSDRPCGIGDIELAKDMLLRVRHEIEAALR